MMMKRTFVFQSGLVTLSDEKLVVRFWARNNATDALTLSYDGGGGTKTHGADADILLVAVGPEGKGSCPELPLGSDVYEPAIEFHFVGEYEAGLIDLDGSSHLRVVMECDVKVEAGAGLGWEPADIERASFFRVSGAMNEGDDGPHFPR